ncbi:MAG: hypothetical protein AB7E51_18655 [Pseudodesulfovibrio sp.]|uniref:hypothetical protein n=1 Tax=Pseudodesulfovibrio sp. TaxID=2035812 RepID=UPI003D13F17A
MIPAIIGAAATIVPSIIRWAAGDKAGEVADKVGAIAKKLVPGHDGELDAMQRIAEDPALSRRFQNEYYAFELELAKLEHEQRMAEIGLADTEGGRELAKTEVASSDEYVRRTRPQLLRWYGKGSFLLIFACVAVAFVSTFTTSVTKEEATFIIDVLKWALPTVSGTFLMMYRAYTGKRTQEKLGAIGLQSESSLDKVVKMVRG